METVELICRVSLISNIRYRTKAETKLIFGEKNEMIPIEDAVFYSLKYLQKVWGYKKKDKGSNPLVESNLDQLFSHPEESIRECMNATIHQFNIEHEINEYNNHKNEKEVLNPNSSGEYDDNESKFSHISRDEFQCFWDGFCVVQEYISKYSPSWKEGYQSFPFSF